jgi:hypothetical protein
VADDRERQQPLDVVLHERAEDAHDHGEHGQDEQHPRDDRRAGNSRVCVRRTA